MFGAFSLVALFPSQFKDMQLIGNSCLCVSPVIDLPSVQSAGLYCSLIPAGTGSSTLMENNEGTQIMCG